MYFAYMQFIPIDKKHTFQLSSRVMLFCHTHFTPLTWHELNEGRKFCFSKWPFNPCHVSRCEVGVKNRFILSSKLHLGEGVN